MKKSKPIYEQLLWVASQLGKPTATPYQISQLAAAVTACSEVERRTIEKWWQRKLKNEQMKALELLETNLAALGFEVVIREKSNGI